MPQGRSKTRAPADTKILPINFTAHVEFAFPVEVSIQLDKDKYPAGTYRLYYYNPVTKQVEDCGDVMVDANGLATFTISHCSDYFITSKAISNLSEINNLVVVTAPKPAPVAPKAVTTVTNPKTSNSDIVAMIFIAIAISLTILSVAVKKRKV